MSAVFSFFSASFFNLLYLFEVHSTCFNQFLCGKYISLPKFHLNADFYIIGIIIASFLFIWSATVSKNFKKKAVHCRYLKFTSGFFGLT